MQGLSVEHVRELEDPHFDGGVEHGILRDIRASHEELVVFRVLHLRAHFERLPDERLALHLDRGQGEQGPVVRRQVDLALVAVDVFLLHRDHVENVAPAAACCVEPHGLGQFDCVFLLVQLRYGYVRLGWGYHVQGDVLDEDAFGARMVSHFFGNVLFDWIQVNPRFVNFLLI